MTVNSVCIGGNLTRDAEIKFTAQNLAIVRFSIAANRRKKDGDQWVDEANFFDVSMVGKAAEAVHKYLEKGKPVVLQGELRQDRWTAQDGTAKSKVYISVDRVQLGGSGGAQAGGKEYRQAQPAQGEVEAFEDDIPF